MTPEPESVWSVFGSVEVPEPESKPESMTPEPESVWSVFGSVAVPEPESKPESMTPELESVWSVLSHNVPIQPSHTQVELSQWLLSQLVLLSAQ